MKHKLMTMLEFVKNTEHSEECSDIYDVWESIMIHSQFLSQPPKLGMFIPCDLEGNVLKKPKRWEDDEDNRFHPFPDNLECEAYQEAKERVIFEGAVLIDNKMEGHFRDAYIEINGQTIMYLNHDLGKPSIWISDHFKTVEDIIRAIK